MTTKRTSGQYEMVLENRQLVFILFGIAMLCGIFFALGFLVGREQRDLGWRANNHKPEMAGINESPSKSLPKKDTPPPTSGASKASDQEAINKELTFYKTIERKSTPNDFKVDPSKEADGRDKQPPKTAPSPATPASAKPIPPNEARPAGSTIIFQVAALSKSAEAEAMARKLKEKGFQAFTISPPNDSSPDKLYRVQVGPFTDATVAEQVKAKLVANGYTPITRK